jgi:hypothetical protein
MGVHFRVGDLQPSQQAGTGVPGRYFGTWDGPAPDGAACEMLRKAAGADLFVLLAVPTADGVMKTIFNQVNPRRAQRLAELVDMPAPGFGLVQQFDTTNCTTRWVKSGRSPARPPAATTPRIPC